MAKPRLYTPAQVGWGAFLGGPIMAVYVLRANFVALGRQREALRTLWIGAALVVALLVLVWILPRNWGTGIPMGYSLAAHQVAKTQQMKKEEILASDTYEKRSTWGVVLRSVGFLICGLILFFVGAFILDALGVPSLDPKQATHAAP